MKRVVVTGGTGFVGSNLIDSLFKNGYEIYAIVRENSDVSKIHNEANIFQYDGGLKSLISFFKDVKPEIVCHLASYFVAEHESNQVDSLIQSNVVFGLHLLEAMAVSKTKKLINTGTSWQYFSDNKYNPVCLYSATKQAFEDLVEYYVQAEGFKVITLILYDTYGEMDTRPKLINLLNKFADEKKELKLSLGNQMLNLVNISDVCIAYLISMNLIETLSLNSHEKYSVVADKNYSLKEVVSTFEKITGKKMNIIWGGRPYRKREVMKVNQNFKKLPKWSCTISLEEGLRRYSK